MKIAKKFLSLVLAGCFLCMTAAGCSDNGASGVNEHNDTTKEYFKILPSAFTDDYIVCTPKMDLEIEKDSTMMPAFSFNVLSKEPLADGAVSVNIDTDIPYDVLYNETTEYKGKFADYICLQYNDMDWNKLKEAENSSDEEEFLAYKAKINSEYESLSDDQFPQFYDNKYTVQFDIDAVNGGEKINEIEIIINDFSTKADIGSISFLDYRSERKNVGDYDLSFNSAGCAGLNIAGNTDGLITVPPQRATVKKDITIKDIYLLNESDTLSIDKVDIDLMSEDANVNQEWKKGEDFEIAKGTEVTFNFEIKDAKLAENQNYAVNVYILIEYEADGKMYVTSNQVLCETRYDGQTLYAMYKDNIDLRPYFEVYPVHYSGK